MKVCHQCQATYRDHVDFCFTDGEVLVPAEAEVAFGPAIDTLIDDSLIDDSLIDDSSIPTEALPRRAGESTAVAVEDGDEDDLLDLIADPSEEPELTHTLRRSELPPDPSAVGVDLVTPEAPWAADIPPARPPTFGAGSAGDDDDESIDDDPTPLASLPVPEPPTESAIPTEPVPRAEVPSAHPELQARDGDTDIGVPPLSGALDEVGIGGPPPLGPAADDSDHDEEHATVGEPPPPRPEQPELTEVRGPPPGVGRSRALPGSDEPTESTEPRLGSAPGALAGLGRRTAAPAPGVSTVQPVAEHPVPTPNPPTRPTPPPRPRAAPARAGLLASGDGASLVMMGLGLSAVAMLTVVALGVLLLTNCNSLFASDEPALEVIEGAPEVGVAPLPREIRTPHEPDAAFREATPAVDTNAPTRGGTTIPVAPGLRPAPSDDGFVSVYFPTDPPGATIRIDGETFDAPGPVLLAGGETFRYEVSSRGYLTVRDSITVPVNQSQIMASASAIQLRPKNTEVVAVAEGPSPAAELTFSPRVWADAALNGCGLLLDGSPVRGTDVVGTDPTLPLKLRSLSLGEHDFQIVGADARCGGHDPETIDFDGRQSLTLRGGR